MLNKLLTCLLFLIFSSLAAYAQEKDTVIVENDEGILDTIIIEDDEWDDEWDNHEDDDWDSNWERDWDDFEWDWDFDGFKGKPAISLSYGFSEVMRDDISAEFAKPRMIEGKLGYATDKSIWESENISKFSYKFLRISNISTELSDEDFNSSELESNLWRFGFGKEEGYGWRFGRSAVIPYHTYAFDWSRLEMKQFPPQRIIDLMYNYEEDVLRRYNESFRFGTSFEAGIRLRIIPEINIDAAYERAQIFERHLFWKWAGSTVIEIAAHGLLNEFIDEIMDSSPVAGPIMNFVLKNALSYSIYELRKEKMNWPFNSAPPLMYEQFKVGVTFVF